MELDERKRYWFPAKRYGWGWGPPSTWQGWVVLLGFILSATIVGVVFTPDVHPFRFGAGILILSGALILICYLKGEPPSWRWGSDSGDLP